MHDAGLQPLTTEKLLPVRVRDLWLGAQEKGISEGECAAKQKQELDQCEAIWTRALKLPGEEDLLHSTLVEIGRWRGIDDLRLVRQRCERALTSLKMRWEQTVREVDTRQVEKYYDTADECIEELMWWHTLRDDNSRLPMSLLWNLHRLLNARLISTSGRV
jgi:hypothetical protein